MIARLAGILRNINNGEAYIDVQGVTYSVLISASLQDELVSTGRVGGTVELAVLHYIEGGVAMSHLMPRLVGFISDSDKAFFAQLITVQGLGVKKALRALTLPIPLIAKAIELNDIQLLKKLPEIGAKTAQKIVMELRGKVTMYASDLTDEAPHPDMHVALEQEYQQEALAILKQLQYNESDAIEIIQRVSTANPSITIAEELIQEVFKRIKS